MGLGAAVCGSVGLGKQNLCDLGSGASGQASWSGDLWPGSGARASQCVCRAAPILGCWGRARAPWVCRAAKDPLWSGRTVRTPGVTVHDHPPQGTVLPGQHFFPLHFCRLCISSHWASVGVEHRPLGHLKPFDPEIYVPNSSVNTAPRPLGDQGTHSPSL